MRGAEKIEARPGPPPDVPYRPRVISACQPPEQSLALLRAQIALGNFTDADRVECVDIDAIETEVNRAIRFECHMRQGKSSAE
jgi:hypothetical protein